MPPSFDYGDEPGFLIVADDRAAAAAARTAVERCGGRALADVGVADAEARLAMQTRVDGLVIELDGIAQDAIAVWLPPLSALARERGVALVVATPAASLDAAWAATGGAAATYLADPDPLDRVIAIASLLPGGHGGFHDVVRDSDERIRQLNAEVARFAERLRQLSGEVVRAGDLREPARSYHGEAAAEPGAAPVAPAVVRAVIRARRLRAAALPGDLFADPAWDMLLDLYAAHLEDRRVSVSSLCIAAAVPGTTALRWIGTMIDAGLFARHADPYDRRRAHVELTDRALAGMARYFASVDKAGLHPA